MAVSASPMTEAGSSAQTLPTLYHVLAISWTYRVVLNAVLYLPKYTLFVPTGLALAYNLLNYFVQGLAWLVLLCTACGWIAALFLLQQLASSPHAFTKALERNRIRLTVLFFVVSGWVCRFVVNGMSNKGFPNIHHRYLSLVQTVLWSGRISLMLVLLGVTVVVRYLGPKSLMRCSAVPLVMNPLDERILAIWKNPAILIRPEEDREVLTLTSMNIQPNRDSRSTASLVPSQLNKKKSLETQESLPFSSWWNLMMKMGSNGKGGMGRRQQHAGWMAVVAQVILAVLLGYGLGWIATPLWLNKFAPLPSSSSRVAKSDDIHGFILLAHVVVFVIHLLSIPILDVHSHELNPKTCYGYHSSLDRELGQLGLRYVRRAIRMGWVSLVVALLLTLNQTSAFQNEWWLSLSPWNLAFFVSFFIYSAGIVLYMLLLNESIQVSLFLDVEFPSSINMTSWQSTMLTRTRAIGNRLDQLLDELCSSCSKSGSNYETEDESDYNISSRKLEVILTSILFNHPYLIRQITSLTASSSLSSTSTTSSRINLSETNALSDSGRLDREEHRRIIDLSYRLAHQVLLSPIQDGISEAPLEEDVLRILIFRQLATGSWNNIVTASDFGAFEMLQPIASQPADMIPHQQQRFPIPLVRALCVFIRGVGEALSTIAGSASSSLSFSDHGRLQRWSLPPGLNFCVECAIQAVSNAILESVTSSRGLGSTTAFSSKPSESRSASLDLWTDWRSSRLARMIPVTLSSFYHFHRSCQLMLNPNPASRSSVESPSTMTNVALTAATQNSEIAKQWMQFVDSATLKIVDAIDLPKMNYQLRYRQDHHYHRFHPMRLNVDDDCMLWMQDLRILSDERNVDVVS